MKKIALFLLIALVLLVSCNQDEIHVHKFDEGTITTAPTCTTEGVKTFKCQCGETKTEKVAALGHDKVEVAAQAATCTEVGWDAYEKCKREGCNYTTYEEIAAKGHSYGELKTTAATCEKDGEEYKICSVCNDKKVEKTLTKLGHNFKGTETIVKAATCTEKGSKTIKCTRCNKTTTEEIAAKGHTEGTPVTTAATCTAAGSTVVKCTVCDAVISTTSIKQLDHDLEKQSTKSEATCAAKKVVTYKCKNCTHTEDIAEGEVNPANHTGGTEWKVTTPAKYFEKGVETEYCKGCSVSLCNTREVAFKALTGFWEGSATIEDVGVVTITASVANNQMTFGMSKSGYYTEGAPCAYTVSTTGITCGSYVYTKVSESTANTGIAGDKITLKVPNLVPTDISVEFERKTTTAHTHTYAEKWEPVEIKDGDTIIGVGHAKKMLCTEHTPFGLSEEHDYSTGDVCIKCGASKYFSVTQGPSSTKKELGLIKKGDSITLPGENTVVYTLNDTTTTYHGGDTYTPTGDVFITDDAYATLSADYKTEYSDILSSHVHSFGEGEVTTVATCTIAGVKTFTCDCGATTTESTGKDATNHTGDKEWKVAKEADAAKYFTEGTETEYCKSCGGTTGNTRKYFKDLTGFWEGTANYGGTTMTVTLSFADEKLTLGMVQSGLYGEEKPCNYTVSSTGITLTGGEGLPSLGYVSEDGDKITLSINDTVNVKFERKTTTAHTHTYAGTWQPVETKDDDGYITEINGHSRNTSCSEHSVFKDFEEHTSTLSACEKCGAKYFQVWKGTSTSSSRACYAKDGESFKLPGENTVVYTLNDTTTTYHGGDTYTPTGDIFITDVAYSTLSDAQKSSYTVFSTYVAPL